MPSNHCDLALPGSFNAVGWMSRALVGEPPYAAYVPLGEEGPTRTRPPTTHGGEDGEPIWLSIQRVGDNFSVARAQDENGRPKIWVPAGGGEYAPHQAYVGVFAARAIANPLNVPNVPTNATFDHLSIRKEGGPRYRTLSLIHI